jgi:hypothetical protein
MDKPTTGQKLFARKKVTELKKELLDKEARIKRIKKNIKAYIKLYNL